MQYTAKISKVIGFKQFEKKLKKLKKNIAPYGKAILSDLAVDTVSEIALENPVYTGRSRKNWRIHVGDINLISYDPVKGEHQTGMKIVPEPASYVINIARNKSKKIKVKGTFYVANNVNYVPVLNYGDERTPKKMDIQSSFYSAIRNIPFLKKKHIGLLGRN